MLIKWIKKKLLKSIIKDITKELPKYKELALMYIEEHSEELLKKAYEAIKNLIVSEIEKVK